MENFWDQKFASDDFLYGKEPNAYIKEKSSLFHPSSILVCLGEGEGRNGVFLSSQGHTVVAIDNSIVGLEKAHRLAEEKGVNITSLLVDLSKWEPKDDVCEGVVTSYCHLGGDLRKEVWQKVFLTLKNEGYFVGEFFSCEQLGYTSGGPKDIVLLYDEKETRELLTTIGFHIVEFCRCETILDEGRGHQGVANVIRFVAQKP